MKTIPSVAAAAALSICAAVSTAFASPDVTPASSVLPVPVSVVHPTDLPLRFKDATVRVELTIDADGVPHDVSAAGAMPNDLAKKLLPVVAQWRFTPMYEDGKPVPVRVILPIELTAED